MCKKQKQKNMKTWKNIAVNLHALKRFLDILKYLFVCLDFMEDSGCLFSKYQ